MFINRRKNIKRILVFLKSKLKPNLMLLSIFTGSMYSLISLISLRTVTSVRGKQVNFSIETTKTVSSARRVVMTPLVMDKLQQLINVLDEMRSTVSFKVEEYYLFIYLEPRKRGIPFRREFVNDHVKRCMHRCRITKAFHTHLARHTMASLVAQHCSWDVLKARLGHADKSTSEFYRHLTSEEKMTPLDTFDDLEN